jgi:hypothetical protein
MTICAMPLSRRPWRSARACPSLDAAVKVGSGGGDDHSLATLSAFAQRCGRPAAKSIMTSVPGRHRAWSRAEPPDTTAEKQGLQRLGVRGGRRTASPRSSFFSSSSLCPSTLCAESLASDPRARVSGGDDKTCHATRQQKTRCSARAGPAADQQIPKKMPLFFVVSRGGTPAAQSITCPRSGGMAHEAVQSRRIIRPKRSAATAPANRHLCLGGKEATAAERVRARARACDSLFTAPDANLRYPRKEMRRHHTSLWGGARQGAARGLFEAQLHDGWARQQAAPA